MPKWSISEEAKRRIDARLSEVPRLAQVAFAARCARLVQPLLKTHWPNAPEEYIRAIDATIQGGELVAAGESVGHVMGIAGAAYKVAERARKHSVEASMVAWVAHCVANTAFSAAYASSFVLTGPNALGAALTVLQLTHESLQMLQDLERDLELLRNACNQKGWGYNDGCIEPHFFTLQTRFDIDSLLDRRSILTISHEASTKLLDYFRRHPQELYRLSAEAFECFVAKVFHEFGFVVELTARTRDGGKDVVAIKHGTSRLRFLIECKRYAPNHRVGVTAVRSLHGVVANEKATKGIIVTTARFSQPAKVYLEENQWILDGRDFDGIVEWLDLYQHGYVANHVRGCVPPEMLGAVHPK